MMAYYKKAEVIPATMGGPGVGPCIWGMNMADLDRRPEAIASCIDFLEDELFEMGLDARMAERALMRHPTCERYKTRLATLYALAGDIVSTLDTLRPHANKRASARRALH